MTNLTHVGNPFAFTDTMVRTAVGPDGQTWFCARDVFAALDIEWKGSAGSLKNTPEKWQTLCYLQTTQGEKATVFLSEPAVYQTAFRSKKPHAQAFVEWACEEVLPALRRQGFFGALPAAQQLGARKCLLLTVKQLKSSNDAFEIALLQQQVRDLCNQLGTSVPPLEWIGRDPRQQPLPGV